MPIRTEPSPFSSSSKPMNVPGVWTSQSAGTSNAVPVLGIDDDLPARDRRLLLVAAARVVVAAARARRRRRRTPWWRLGRIAARVVVLVAAEDEEAGDTGRDHDGRRRDDRGDLRLVPSAVPPPGRRALAAAPSGTGERPTPAAPAAVRTGWAADTPAAGIRAAGTDSAAGTPAAGTGSGSGPAGSARPRAAAVLATWGVTLVPPVTRFGHCRSSDMYRIGRPTGQRRGGRPLSSPHKRRNDTAISAGCWPRVATRG